MLVTAGAQMVWIVLSNIILMNVLIAMMNTTCKPPAGSLPSKP